MEDPLRSIQTALALPDARQRRYRLLWLADAWARAAPEQAWQGALRIADPQARRILLSAMVLARAQLQPAEAFAGVADLPAGRDRSWLLEQVSAQVARHDPQLALELISSTDLPDVDAYRAMIVGQWSRYDPVGAAQWVERQDAHLQEQFAYQIAEAYVEQQPQQALEWALRINRSPEGSLWSYMLRQMAVYEPEEALRIALAAENPAHRHNALGGVLSSIAVANPGLARSYLDRVPAGNRRAHVTLEIMSNLMETSTTSVVEWVDSLEDDATREQMWMQAGSLIAHRDPDAAAELLDRVPGAARESWITTVAAAYANIEPARAVQWVKTFEHEPGYPRIVQQLAMTASGRNPEAALEIVNHTVVGKDRERVLAEIMSMLAHQAPDSAASLLDELSDESLRLQSIGAVATAWAQFDPDAALKWMTSLPPGPSRDRALIGIIGAAAASADETLSLIRQVSPDLRQTAVLNAAQRLSRTDPEGMRAVLLRYPLEPNYQQQLESILGQQGIDSW